MLSTNVDQFYITKPGQADNTMSERLLKAGDQTKMEDQPPQTDGLRLTVKSETSLMHFKRLPVHLSVDVCLQIQRNLDLHLRHPNIQHT